MRQEAHLSNEVGGRHAEGQVSALSHSKTEHARVVPEYCSSEGRRVKNAATHGSMSVEANDTAI